MSKFTEAYNKLKEFTLNSTTSQLNALNGILDKLPDALKKDFVTLRDTLLARKTEIETLLASAPTDEDAATALQSFFTSFTKLRENTDGLMNSLQAALAQNEKTATALQGLEKKIADGDYLAKDKVKELTDKAASDASAAILPQLTALRKSSIALAGLPEPGEEVLKLPADKFEALLKAAQTNVKTLGDEFGFALNGKGESWVKESAWLDGSAFQNQVAKIKELLPAKKAAGDPLLGGGSLAAPTGAIRFA